MTAEIHTSAKINSTSFVAMSDLYRSTLSARLAKLPADIPSNIDIEDEDEEVGDSLGSLPGSGLGPPAMQVYDIQPWKFLLYLRL